MAKSLSKLKSVFTKIKDSIPLISQKKAKSDPQEVLMKKKNKIKTDEKPIKQNSNSTATPKKKKSKKQGKATGKTTKNIKKRKTKKKK